MDREDVRIPCTTMARVWSASMEQTGDPNLAMRLGATRLFGAGRTTSLIMETSSTVLEAFELAIRYSDLIADVMRVELGELDDVVYLEFAPEPIWRDQPERVQLDCLAITYVAAVSSLGRLLATHQPPVLLSVAFPRPSDVSIWSAIFDRPVDFDATHNRIGFPAELKSSPVATRDPGLKAAIRTYADDLRSTFRAEPPTTRMVIGAIVEGMAPEPPSVDSVARSLGMSTRSLQRSLRAEGHTYREMVQRVRMDLSEHHLREGSRSVDEVARLAGYADTSSFVRAFKRAKGQPPRRYARGHS